MDCSRGLPGGSFHKASLINRRDAKEKFGKQAIDTIGDFIKFNCEVRFNHYFIQKYQLDVEKDNTPDHIKRSSTEQQVKYVHDLVEPVLKELLPFLRHSKNVHHDLYDHPLQEGRRHRFNSSSRQVSRSSLLPCEPIENSTINLTVDQLHIPEKNDIITSSLNKGIHEGRFVNGEFKCMKCSFVSKYKTVFAAHRCPVGVTMVNDDATPAMDDLTSRKKKGEKNMATEEAIGNTTDDGNQGEVQDDDFWNYLNGEFFLDSLFDLNSIFIKYGDGLGCFILGKILMRIYQGLGHKNYSNTIFRHIFRILCEATPKEALSMLYDRFNNRHGRFGGNIPKDLRLEHWILVAKNGIKNLGPNANPRLIQRVNATLDVMEKLFLKMRETHGIRIRGGKHRAPSDDHDYVKLFNHLTDVEAHKKVSGRTFGNLKYPENLLEDERFDITSFCRWLLSKKSERISAFNARKNLGSSSAS